MTVRNSYMLFVVIVLFAGLFSQSCSRHSDGVLNQRKMENLLVDMHMLEGSLRASGYASYNHDADDRALYYSELFGKYGITKAEFDSCLSWYTKHPREFERIYTNVIARIETLRTEIEHGKFHPVDSTLQSGVDILWNPSVKYVFTKDSARNHLPFEIINHKLLPEDRYELSFLHRIAPSDSSINHHTVMYVNYMDGTVDSIYTKTKNDSVLRRYTLKFGARKNLSIKSLSGYILGNDSSIGQMNAVVDSVKLIRRFNPFRQDSIRNALNKTDNTTKTIPLTPTDMSTPAEPVLLPEETKQKQLQ